LSRLVVPAVLIFLWTGAAAAGDVAPRRFVDLAEPGALEALQQSNPAHFEKVRQIMSGAALHANANVPSRWMLTNFNARGAIGPPLMSYPTKQYVSFTLDGTRYEGFVTMEWTVTAMRRLKSEIQNLEQELRLRLERASEPSPK
jgi:hypothetical protein